MRYMTIWAQCKNKTLLPYKGHRGRTDKSQHPKKLGVKLKNVMNIRNFRKGSQITCFLRCKKVYAY